MIPVTMTSTLLLLRCTVSSHFLLESCSVGFSNGFMSLSFYKPRAENLP